jgi:hypothetical protein
MEVQESECCMQARVYLVVLVAWVVVSGGCRGLPQLAPLPTAHEVPIQQLVFHCDFELPDDHRLVRELTAERDPLYHELGLPPSNEPVHVYLFHDAEAYAQYLNRHFPNVPARRAFFVESDTELAVFAHWSDRVAEDLRHEVAHGYLHAAVPNLPLWLDEGLAEYFEVPRGHGGMNRPHVDLLRDLTEHNGWQPDLKRLEALTSAEQMGQADYAEAWAWVYWMLTTEPDRREALLAYLQQLRDQGRAEPLSVELSAQTKEPEQALAEFLIELGE